MGLNCMKIWSILPKGTPNSGTDNWDNVQQYVRIFFIHPADHISVYEECVGSAQIVALFLILDLYKSWIQGLVQSLYCTILSMSQTTHGVCLCETLVRTGRSYQEAFYDYSGYLEAELVQTCHIEVRIKDDRQCAAANTRCKHAQWTLRITIILPGPVKTQSPHWTWCSYIFAYQCLTFDWWNAVRVTQMKQCLEASVRKTTTTLRCNQKVFLLSFSFI